jgi:hypothetical protein
MPSNLWGIGGGGREPGSAARRAGERVGRCGVGPRKLVCLAQVEQRVGLAAGAAALAVEVHGAGVGVGRARVVPAVIRRLAQTDQSDRLAETVVEGPMDLQGSAVGVGRGAGVSGDLVAQSPAGQDVGLTGPVACALLRPEGPRQRAALTGQVTGQPQHAAQFGQRIPVRPRVPEPVRRGGGQPVHGHGAMPGAVLQEEVAEPGGQRDDMSILMCRDGVVEGRLEVSALGTQPRPGPVHIREVWSVHGSRLGGRRPRDPRNPEFGRTAVSS